MGTFSFIFADVTHDATSSFTRSFLGVMEEGHFLKELLLIYYLKVAVVDKMLYYLLANVFVKCLSFLYNLVEDGMFLLSKTFLLQHTCQQANCSAHVVQRFFMWFLCHGQMNWCRLGVFHVAELSISIMCRYVVTHLSFYLTFLFNFRVLDSFFTICAFHLLITNVSWWSVFLLLFVLSRFKICNMIICISI